MLRPSFTRVVTLTFALVMATFFLVACPALVANKHQQSNPAQAAAQTQQDAVPATAAVTMQTLSKSTMQPTDVTYKKIGDTKLTFQLFTPPARKPGVKTPAVVFVHGGGWTAGDTSNYAMHCRYLAMRGDVVFNIIYRLVNKDGTMFDALYDCNSAVRFIRKHAADYGIDPQKIAVLGESAGGHLVAAMGTIPGMDEPGESTKVSAAPNLMIILNPITDLPATPWFLIQKYDGINTEVTTGPGAGKTTDEKRHMLSPIFYVHAGQVPCLLLHGTKDTCVDIAQSDKFAAAMTKAGNECEYHRMEGCTHAFLYPDIPYCGNEKSFVDSMRLIDAFLVKHGYLEGSATLTMGTAH